jgi:hypothetical protein
MKSNIFKNATSKGTIVLILVFLVCYLLTTLYYIFNKGGRLYLYSEKSDSNPIFYESRRKLLIKNLSLIDRLFVIGYHGGYVDGLDDLRNANTGKKNFDMDALKKRIDDQGTCTLSGKEVSMYAYYYTYTLFGMPYKEYVITCKQIEIKSPIDYLLQRKTVRFLNN